MIKSRPAAVGAPVALAGVALLVACTASDVSTKRTWNGRERLTVEAVTRLLQESPDEYIVGVQEVVDDSRCYGPTYGSSCPLTVRMVKFIAGEPGRLFDRHEGWTYCVMEMRMEKPWPNRSIGRKRLVVSVPTKVSGLYGNGLFIVDPTKDDIQRLRKILDTVQTSRSSNHRLSPPVGPVTGLAEARPAPVPPRASRTLDGPDTKEDTMKPNPTLAWVVASALGLGLGFDAMLLPDFIGSGIAPDEPYIPTPALWDLASTVMMWVVGGLVLGGAQALVLRSSALHLGHWMAATAVGFSAAALTIACPLQAAGVLGRIPGPAEPIMFTIGGCVGAGVFQWLLLRRQGFVAGRWLRLWIAGLVLSLVPTVLVFFVLQGLLGLEIVWPVEVFLNGLMCAGVAAWVSGRLTTACSGRRFAPPLMLSVGLLAWC